MTRFLKIHKKTEGSWWQICLLLLDFIGWIESWIMWAFYASFFCLISFKAVPVRGQTFKESLDLNDLPETCAVVDLTRPLYHCMLKYFTSSVSVNFQRALKVLLNCEIDWHFHWKAALPEQTTLKSYFVSESWSKSAAHKERIWKQ